MRNIIPNSVTNISIRVMKVSLLIFSAIILAFITYWISENELASIVVFLEITGLFAYIINKNKLAAVLMSIVAFIGTLIAVIPIKLDFKTIISSTIEEVTRKTDTIPNTLYNPLIYDKGVVINGVCWATRNVDKPGTFTENLEDPGMFYQWNSKVGWSVTDPLTSTDGSFWNNRGNGNNTTTWQTANNICPTSWRLPTIEELQSLIDAGSAWTTTPAKGRIFGSNPNRLFLPGAGYRSSDNGSLIAGYYIGNTSYYNEPTSYYWSSTTPLLHIGIDMDFGVVVSSGAYIVSETNHRFGHGHYCYGFSVRCVAE
jgi:uncharacterized protein (TIGR02145 family)